MADEFSFFPNASSYAKLSADALKSLGKEAALDFLNEGISLNDAVVKVAQRYPSISTHQVRRVVEFANQEAFAHLFEKQASDKNIDFDIANPSEVLHIINSGVKPVEVMSLPEEYSMGPVKMASSDLEADLALASVFGVDLHFSNIEKAASASSSLDRIFEKLGMGEAMPMAGSNPNDGMSADEHHERMLALQREIELAKKREELSKIQHKANQEMGLAPPEQMGEQAPQQGQEQIPQEQMQGGMPMEAAQPMMPAPQPMPEENPQPLAGPIVAPPGAGVPKTASNLLAQAISYAKAERPLSTNVASDLSKAASLGSIKSSVNSRMGYPSANPHRELVETRQKIAKLQEEAVCAADTNRFMAKEAADRFYKEAEQFLWDGGELGEVIHMMEMVSPSSTILKTSSAALVTRLEKRGLDKTAARARLISYEMGNRGRSRDIDYQHPVSQCYGTFCKLASNQGQLDVAKSDLTNLKKQLDTAISAVWRDNASHQ